MTQLTHEQLQHLAKLSSIKIDATDEEQILPQLDKIITFVEKLNNCDIEGISDRIGDHTIICNEGIEPGINKDDFLDNVNNPTDSGAIMLDVSTNE